MNSVSSIDFCNDTIQFYFASAYISYSLNAQPICTMRKFFFLINRIWRWRVSFRYVSCILIIHIFHHILHRQMFVCIQKERSEVFFFCCHHDIIIYQYVWLRTASVEVKEVSFQNEIENQQNFSELDILVLIPSQNFQNIAENLIEHLSTHHIECVPSNYTFHYWKFNL